MAKKETKQPAAEKRGAEKRGAEKRGAEKRGAEKRGAEKRGGEKQAAEKTGGENRGGEKQADAPAGTPRMLDFYVNTVRPQLAQALSRTNPHAIPKLEKIVVNMGVGVAVSEKKYLEEAIGAMTQVTGQKPVATLSKVAVSGFKLRENLPIGCKVTLRGRRMYEFFDRLVSLALPRVRDFRGLSSTAFDGHGNYSLGLSEQMVFPEINPDRYTRPQGMHITLVTSARNDDEAREFLRAMGMPLKKDGKDGE
jgi:large subunit ribosomal protein L5